MTTLVTNYRFAFNNFEFGGGNSVYQILTVDGLEDLPDLRVQDDNRGYQDGMFTGRDFLSGRTIVIKMFVFGDVNNSMMKNLNALQTVLTPQQQGTGTLQFKLPNNSEQFINARVRRRSVQINSDYSVGRAVATYEFFCPDPRYYDITQRSANIAASSAIVGRTYNRVYNMLYGGGSTFGLITNSGWTTTYPIITITGPCINPKVIDQSTGQFLEIDYTLAVSDTIVLNTDLKTVQLNGVNRRALLTNASSWFAAPPGTSIYSFFATGTGSGTSCLVEWYNAYI